MNMKFRVFGRSVVTLALSAICTPASAQRITDVTIKNDAQDVHIHVLTTTPRHHGWKGIRLMIDTDDRNRIFEYQYNEHDGPYSARYDARSKQWLEDVLPQIRKVNDSHWVYIFNRKQIGIGQSRRISVTPLLLLNNNEEIDDYTYSFTLNDNSDRDYAPLIAAGIAVLGTAYLLNQMTTPSDDEKRRRCSKLLPGDISWSTLGCGN